jgi:hypothetical protein
MYIMQASMVICRALLSFAAWYASFQFQIKRTFLQGRALPAEYDCRVSFA